MRETNAFSTLLDFARLPWTFADLFDAGLVVYIAMRALGFASAALSAAIAAALIEEVLRHAVQARFPSINPDNQRGDL